MAARRRTRASFSGEALTGQLSSDLKRIPSITLKAARIDAIDGAGDVSFVSSGSIEVSGTQLPTVRLATIQAPAAAGATSVAFSVNSSMELKPYLQQNGSLAVSVGYSPTPSSARRLKLTLTLHGALLQE